MTAWLLAAALAAAPDLTTVAERSGWVRTGRYEEVERLCPAFEKAYPGRVRCVRFGETPEGRPMLALVASEDSVLDPATARKRERPVLLVQGGIHAGEIDGKDAGFAALRDLLSGTAAPGALSRFTLVFVPVLNVDGHERFGPDHRPNQRGPEEMGWRTTARNLNLNRDYAKAEAPETRALLALGLAWDPVVAVDLHVTDGAKFRHDVSVLVDPAEEPGAAMGDAALALRKGILERLGKDGHLPLGFYPQFVTDDAPESGFAVGVAPPRFSNPYWSLRDRMGILVETHSWHPYPERVKATRDTLLALFAIAARDAASWRDAERAADAAAAKCGGKEVVFSWENDDRVETIDFLGYAYRREPSEVSGAVRIIYDETKPEVWRVPLKAGLAPKGTATAPAGGWIVPPAWADLVRERLAVHGFRAERLVDRRSGVAARRWKARTVTFGATPFEGRQTAKAEGEWTSATVDVEPGSLWIPAGQPGWRLLVHLLTPEAPDSLVSWGYFNAIFEAKEYMEAYVAEEVGEGMLRDPVVRREFLSRLSDPAFASDPKARLEFFYRRDPSWDDRRDVYPVLRVEDEGRFR